MLTEWITAPLSIPFNALLIAKAPKKTLKNFISTFCAYTSSMNRPQEASNARLPTVIQVVLEPLTQFADSGELDEILNKL